MKIIDISQEFFSCRVYPGDSPPTYKRVKTIETDGHNLTEVSMNVHNGTHIDAPLHFVKGGKAIHELDLSVFNGQCTVAEFGGIISENDMATVIQNSRGRLLLKGDCILSDEAAVIIANSHIKLVGVEGQTVGHPDAPKKIHLILLEKEIIPLEGLDLSKVRPGDYTLSAYPLNMRSSDGSPVRALLMPGAIDKNRDFMKCPDFAAVMPHSDQEKKLPQPPLFDGRKAESDIIELPDDFAGAITCDCYTQLLDIRRSKREFDENAEMTQAQLALLLWSTQGVQDIRGNNYMTLRPVPSGGARHPFETYFIARSIQKLKPGLYHYLPQEHIGEKRVSVEFMKELPDLKKVVPQMLAGQGWAASAQAVVFLVCDAYRAEWRYSDLAHRVALIDAGHVGQNQMLSAAAMGLGICCIAAYNQKLCDDTLGLDGTDQYTVYACAVGVPEK